MSFFFLFNIKYLHVLSKASLWLSQYESKQSKPQFNYIKSSKLFQICMFSSKKLIAACFLFSYNSLLSEKVIVGNSEGGFAHLPRIWRPSTQSLQQSPTLCKVFHSWSRSSGQQNSRWRIFKGDYICITYRQKLSAMKQKPRTCLQLFCAFTWFNAVGDLCIRALIFIKSCDLEHSWAHGCRFKHTARVRCAYKPGCIVIGVIHVDNHTYKVPFHWDVLVSNLKKKNVVPDRQRQEEKKQRQTRAWEPSRDN